MFDSDHDIPRSLLAEFLGPRRTLLAIGSTVALLGCIYLLLVAPILDTANRAIDGAGANVGPAVQYPGSEPAGAWQPLDDSVTRPPSRGR